MSEAAQIAIEQANAMAKDLDASCICGFTDFPKLDHIAAFCYFQDHMILPIGGITESAMQSQYLKMLERCKMLIDGEIAKAERRWGLKLTSNP